MGYVNTFLVISMTGFYTGSETLCSVIWRPENDIHETLDP